MGILGPPSDPKRSGDRNESSNLSPTDVRKTQTDTAPIGFEFGSIATITPTIFGIDSYLLDRNGPFAL